MAKYTRKPEIVDATQWFKHGDHPKVHRLYDNIIFGNLSCPQCNLPRKRHGYLDDNCIICPGDWIIIRGDNRQLTLKSKKFNETYQEVKP